LRVAAGPLGLVPELEVAEPGELDALPALERPPDFLEEGFDHVLGLTLVEADLLEQQVGELGLRQRHCDSLESHLSAQRCGEFAAQQTDQLVAGSVRLRIRKGSFSMLHNYPKSKAF